MFIAATLSAEGAGLSASGTCSDLAGNTSGAATATANIDKTPPAADVVVPANFGSYVQGSSLTASFGCTDALSGVVSCVGSVGNGAAIDTSSAGARVFNATATDSAGNAGTASHTFEIAAVDATLPVSGGSVADVDPETGVTTTLSVPAGVLSQPTQVAVPCRRSTGPGCGTRFVFVRWIEPGTARCPRRGSRSRCR